MLYPVITRKRAVLDISGIWQFKLDNNDGFENKWFENRLVDSLAIAVPASYNDQFASEIIKNHFGWVFYQKEIEIPEILKRQRIVLRFGAVTHQAIIYLNGLRICQHVGGFLPFEVEINEFLIEDANLLTVAVDNKIDHGTLPVGSELGESMLSLGVGGLENSREKKNFPNFDFFNYAGITRPVKIYTTPHDYIKDVTISTDIQENDGVVRFEIKTTSGGQINVHILNENNDIVAVSNGERGELLIKNVKLWSPLNAYLYKARVIFKDDCYEILFGVRTIEVKNAQFLINGQSFYFKGFGKHEDTSFRGRGLDEVANVADISILKWIGANSFRTSHYPYAEEMLNLCDREGIVVISETPAVGLNFNIGNRRSQPVDTFSLLRTFDYHKEVLKDLIERDKNHPCVVMWSIANEADTQTDAKSAYEYFRPLYDLAHTLDPQNRPVTNVGFGRFLKEDKSISEMDVICLNRYYGWYVFGGDLESAKIALEKELELWKTFGKPLMFTEYGADTVAGLHSVVPTMFTEEYQVEFLKANHEIFDKFDFFIGEHVWNFADFQTEQGILRVDGNKKGVFTRDRKPKLAAHYLRSRWTKIKDFRYK